ncbi:MAG: hypothetical protein KatS3mg061_2450 [Dehalococcoidia bacterium]|nr:MAG: hypothetical protein KatS3mg061_2450 [Dehalococcoidia bacterium]
MRKTDRSVGFEMSESMADPRADSRRTAILEAALRVFSRFGYHLTSIDHLAAAAQTSKGGIYFHFPSKQALFLALLDRAASQLRARVEAAMVAAPDPVAKADAALRTVLHVFAAHRDLARLLLVETLGAGREFHQRRLQLQDEFVSLIRQQLDAAVAAGSIPPLDTALAARVWFGALNEVVTAWVLAERPGTLEEVYPTLRSLLLRSIGMLTEAQL